MRISKQERWDTVHKCRTDNPTWSHKKISAFTNIPMSSVGRLLLETRPEDNPDDNPEKRGPKHIFSAVQQATLVGMVVFMVTCGIGMETADVWEMSKDFYLQVNKYEPDQWFCKKTITRMLDAHGYSRRTENCIAFKRSEAHRAEIILNYDSLVRATLIENNCAKYDNDGKFIITQPGCIWNADETALRGKLTRKRRVWVRRGQKEVFTVDSDTDSKEMITGLFFISLSGECLSPLVLFDTQYTNSHHLIPDCDINVASNGSGWMTQGVLFNLFETRMLDELKSRAPEGVTPTLLWDSHSSHLSYNLLKLCRDNGVACQAIPPNGSILYQPLDNRFNAVIQNRIAGVRAPDHYNFKQKILYKVKSVLSYKAEMTTLVQGAWAACGFVKIPGSADFTFDKEILMARLPANVSRIPICKRISEQQTRDIAGDCIDTIIADNAHKRKRESEPETGVMNKRKRVGEWGVVSTSEQFLEVLRIGEEEKQAKKAEKDAKKADKENKTNKTVKNNGKNQNIANFFNKKT